MNKQTLFWLGIIVFVVGLAGGIFFMIPGINHIITTSATHVKHAAAFFVIAVLGILVTVINRPQPRIS